mgnify:CR=1 FL=1
MSQDIISSFQRYEVKYFLTPRQREHLLPELEELALDVIERWLDEKDGKTDTGRVLPREYLFFTGDGEHNHFRTEWDGGQVWDWSLQSPYEE